MHAKTDSEVTSLAPSSPPRSPRRPIYYVMSPSQPDAEKMSLAGSTPGASPFHHHHHQQQHRYVSSPIHHSRESSTTRCSASLKHNSWRKLGVGEYGHGVVDEGDDEEGEDRRIGIRCYVILFVIGFVLLFSLFSLILWGASKSYKPEIYVKGMVFEFYNVQAGIDQSGVPTKMVSINSTVKIRFRNPGTFFGVHVTSTPLELYYSELKVASGQMKEFFDSRKAGRVVSVSIVGTQVPVYGGGSTLKSGSKPLAVVPLDLTFVVRARANILGKLVKTKFYRHVHCALHLLEERLGKPVLNLRKACEYHD